MQAHNHVPISGGWKSKPNISLDVISIQRADVGLLTSKHNRGDPIGSCRIVLWENMHHVFQLLCTQSVIHAALRNAGPLGNTVL